MHEEMNYEQKMFYRKMARKEVHSCIIGNNNMKRLE